MIMNIFAQATNVPSNGASNAEDFQPLTRNPQSARGSLQPGAEPQQTSDRDILGQEGARIIVPVGESQPVADQSNVSSGGVNWLLVVVAAAVIVVALEYVLRRRERQRHKRPSWVSEKTPQEVITLPANEEPAQEIESVPENPQPVPKASPTKKKKSKSKRKRSRK